MFEKAIFLILFWLVCQSNTQSTSKITLPFDGTLLGHAQLNGLLYFAVNNDTASYLFSYNTNTKIWLDPIPLPGVLSPPTPNFPEIPRFRFDGGIHDKIVFAFNGGPSYFLIVYSPSLQQLVDLSKFDPGISRESKTQTHLVLYSASYTSDQFVVTYDISLNLADIQGSRIQHVVDRLGSLAIGPQHIAYGGGQIQGRFPTPRLEVFTPGSGWSLAANNLTIARWNLTSVVVGDLVLFAGGRNGSSLFSRVDALDMTTGQVSNFAELSLARHAMAATVVNNKAIFAGGFDLLNDVINRVDIYNSQTKQWTAVDLANVDALNAIVPYQSILWGSRIVFLSSGAFKHIIMNSNTGTSSLIELFRYTSTPTVIPMEDSMWTIGDSLAQQVDVFASCENTNCVDDGVFCTAETCINTVCVLRYPCPDDACNNTCNETARNCFNPASYSCDDKLRCNGVDTCDGVGNCVHSGSPCNETVCFGCVEMEPNEALQCQPLVKDCSDGIWCNGLEVCAAGECVNATPQCDSGSVCNNVCNEMEKTCFAPTTATCTKEDGTESLCNGNGLCGFSNSKKKSNTPLIVGIVVPVVVLASAAAVLSFLYVRKRRNSDASHLELAVLGELQDIKVEYKIGGGSFGEVYKGTLNDTTPVALKKLKEINQMKEFAREAILLKSLQHPNIVQYLGIYKSNGEEYIVTEYMSEGSVQSLVLKESKSLKLDDLLSMAKQAAAGMTFLDQKNIVHRDLALRNLLATKSGQEKYLVKISDFGMSKVVETGYYLSKDQTIPVKWTSPEAIEYAKFSSKSDVWSFGILLWELFSYGKMPYATLSNAETLQQVKNGYRMPAPQGCPEEIYQIMCNCWNEAPDKRPTFKEIHQLLSNLTNNTQSGSTSSTHFQASPHQSSTSFYANSN